jgi:uncharacterized protein (UPF0261 family)
VTKPTTPLAVTTKDFINKLAVVKTAVPTVLATSALAKVATLDRETTPEATAARIFVKKNAAVITADPAV